MRVIFKNPHDYNNHRNIFNSYYIVVQTIYFSIAANSNAFLVEKAITDYAWRHRQYNVRHRVKLNKPHKIPSPYTYTAPHGHSNGSYTVIVLSSADRIVSIGFLRFR